MVIYAKASVYISILLLFIHYFSLTMFGSVLSLFIMKSLIVQGDEGDVVCLYHAIYSTNVQCELQSQSEATRLRWQNNAEKNQCRLIKQKQPQVFLICSLNNKNHYPD